MSTISDTGTFEIKRIRIEEEIAAVQYGTENHNKDLVFKVGDLSHPHQAVRFHVHDGTSYRQAFAVNKDGFTLEQLNLEGPSSAMIALDAPVTMGEVRIDHYTANASTREGQLNIRLNDGTDNTTLTTFLWITPIRTTVYNALELRSTLSVASLASVKSLLVEGDTSSRTIASFAHPLGEGRVAVHLNADGRLEMMASDLSAGALVASALGVDDAILTNLEAQVATLGELRLGAWRVRPEDLDLLVSGEGAVVVGALSTAAAYVEVLSVSGVAGTSLVLSSNVPSRLFSADGVTVDYRFPDPTLLSTPELSVATIRGDTVRFQLSTGIEYNESVLMQPTDNGVKYVVDGADTLRLERRTLDAGGLRSMDGALSVATLEATYVTSGELSGSSAHLSSADVGVLSVGSARAGTLSSGDVHASGGFFTASMSAGSDTFRFAVNGIQVLHMDETGLDAHMLSTTSLYAGAATTGSLSVATSFAASAAYDLISSSEGVVGSLSASVAQVDALQTHVISLSNGNVLRISGPVVAASLSVADVHACSLVLSTAALACEEVANAVALSTSAAVHAAQVVTPDLSCATLRVASVGDGVVTGGTFAVSAGYHSMTDGVEEMGAEATLDVRSRGKLIHLASNDHHGSIEFDDRGALVVSAASLRLPDVSAPSATLSLGISAASATTGTLSVGEVISALTAPTLSVATGTSEMLHTLALHSVVLSCAAIVGDVLSFSVTNSWFQMDEMGLGVNRSPEVELDVLANAPEVALRLQSTEGGVTLRASAGCTTLSTSAPIFVVHSALSVADLYASKASFSTLTTPEGLLRVDDTTTVECTALSAGDLAARGLSCASIQVEDARLTSANGRVTLSCAHVNINCEDGFRLGDVSASARSVSIDSAADGRLAVRGLPGQAAIVAEGHGSASVRVSSPFGIPRHVEFQSSGRSDRTWWVGVRNLPDEEEDAFGVYHGSRAAADYSLKTTGAMLVNVPLLVPTLSVNSSWFESIDVAAFDVADLTAGTISVASFIAFDDGSNASTIRLSAGSTLHLSTGGLVVGGGDVDMGANSITNLASPVDGADAANRTYVLQEVQNLLGVSNRFLVPQYFEDAGNPGLDEYAVGVGFASVGDSTTSATTSFEILVGSSSDHSLRFATTAAESSVLLELSPSPREVIVNAPLVLNDNISVSGSLLHVSGSDVQLTGSLGIGVDPSYKLHVAGTSSTIGQLETSDRIARAVVRSTTLSSGQVMTSYTAPNGTYSSGYNASTGSYSIAFGTNLSVGTQLDVSSTQTKVMGDVRIVKDSGALVIEEETVDTVVIDKTRLELENFAIRFNNPVVQHELGGLDILTILSTGAAVRGSLSISGGLTFEGTTLEIDDDGQLVTDARFIGGAIEGNNLTLQSMLGFNLYRDESDIVRFASTGGALLANFDNSLEKLTFAYGVAPNLDERGALFSATTPTLTLTQGHVGVNTALSAAALDVSIETGPQLALHNPANLGVRATVRVEDNGSASFTTSQNSFKFTGDVIATNYVYIGQTGTGRWRLAVNAQGLAVEVLSGGSYVTRHVFQ